VEEPKRPNIRMLIGLMVLFAFLGIAAIFMDWKEIRKLVGQADWRLIAFVLLFTALSYTCIGYGFATANRIFGVRLSQPRLAEIGFVSLALNNLLSAGGAAGYSVRFLVMRGQGVSISDIVAASVFHSYFTSLAMLALLPIGLANLYLHGTLPPGGTAGVGIAAISLMVVFAFATALLFLHPLRRAVLDLLGRAWRKIRRGRPLDAFQEFDSTLSYGVNTIRARPQLLVLLLLLIMMDWSSSIMALWFCFDALGEPLDPGVLITGFALGITAGVLSMIPGGLGVQEGSMSGIYALLGVPLPQAVLAAILFRVIYYFIPFFISLGFYWRMVKWVNRRGSASRV
jgi:uncharacterized protein (TIRG00374 family)